MECCNQRPVHFKETFQVIDQAGNNSNSKLK